MVIGKDSPFSIRNPYPRNASFTQWQSPDRFEARTSEHACCFTSSQFMFLFLTGFVGVGQGLCPGRAGSGQDLGAGLYETRRWACRW